jgi:CheY-like chemotaxis protein
MAYEKADIMLVEDSDDDAEFFQFALKQTGFMGQVRIANNGAEALASIFGVGKAADGLPVMRPRLVVLDLKLPKVNGMEVLHRLRTNSHTKNIPVVVLSSSQDKRDLTAAYQLGANSYLVKPMDFDEFTGLVQTLTRYWLEYNQLLTP